MTPITGGLGCLPDLPGYLADPLGCLAVFLGWPADQTGCSDRPAASRPRWQVETEGSTRRWHPRRPRRFDWRPISTIAARIRPHLRNWVGAPGSRRRRALGSSRIPGWEPVRLHASTRRRTPRPQCQSAERALSAQPVWAAPPTAGFPSAAPMNPVGVLRAQPPPPRRRRLPEIAATRIGPS